MRQDLSPQIRGWPGLRARRLVLALDYDGTLVPICQKPEQAHPDAELLNLLRELTETVSVIILTGRAAKDMERWVSEPAIVIVASHGAEWRHKGLWKPLLLTPGNRNPLKTLVAGLKKAFRENRGVIIEVKGFTVAFHYRLVKSGSQANILNRFEEIVGRWMALNEGFEILDGKAVKEIRPQGLDKGKALRRVLEMLGVSRASVLAMGDDRTDEDTFQSLGNQDLGILVGSGPSSATVHLRDVWEARHILKGVLRIRQTSGNTSQKSE